MSLYETYESMQKVAAEQQEMGERVEVLNKFASLAAEELEAKYPGQWTKEDQYKLASALIELAVNQEETEVEEQSKIAEICESAHIFAEEVWKNLENLAAQNSQ